MNLSIWRPWHWAHQFELGQVFNVSACHEHIVRENASWLQRVAGEGVTEELKRVQRRSLLIIHPSWNSEPQMPSWLGPGAKRWLWSALTIHLLRVRKDLERRVLTHPAIETLAQSYGPDHPVSQFLRSGRLLRFEPCHPEPVLFDVGMHVRQGDACGTLAVSQPSRRCVKSLAQALGMVAAANLSFDHGASRAKKRVEPQIRTFLASDSDTIIEQAAIGGSFTRHASVFTIGAFAFNRTKYDGAAFIEFEQANARRGDRSEVLVETLLDLALLARSDCIAGSMMGNLPRVALQLRLRADQDECYVSLDERTWCTYTKCGLCTSAKCVEQSEWRGRHVNVVRHGEPRESSGALFVKRTLNS